MGKGSRNSRSDSGGGGNADTCASSPVDHNFSTPAARRQVAEQTGPEDPHLPTMIVFDLDFCLWNPEMHELSGMPSVEVEGPLDPDGDVATTPLGCVGLSVPKRRRNGRGRTIPSWELDDGYGGDETVRLFDGARRALRELALNPCYRGIVLACASSSLEPSYSHACLDKLEVLPDLTLREMFTYNQIGRTGKLSPRKTTHFRELHRESGVPYHNMLFFDDCGYGDHVSDLEEALGVQGVRTPNGLTFDEFMRGLEEYRRESEQREGEK